MSPNERSAHTTDTPLHPPLPPSYPHHRNHAIITTQSHTITKHNHTITHTIAPLRSSTPAGPSPPSGPPSTGRRPRGAPKPRARSGGGGPFFLTLLCRAFGLFSCVFCFRVFLFQFSWISPPSTPIFLPARSLSTRSTPSLNNTHSLTHRSPQTDHTGLRSHQIRSLTPNLRSITPSPPTIIRSYAR